jgi:hypothetical protein
MSSGFIPEGFYDPFDWSVPVPAGSPEVGEPIGSYVPEPFYPPEPEPNVYAPPIVVEYYAPPIVVEYVPPETIPLFPEAAPVANEPLVVTMDYYGNIVDSHGNLIETRYYESQAWKDQVAANNAVQAATEVVRQLGVAIDSGQTIDPAVWNVAVTAEGRAVQAYERVGGEYHDTTINTGYAQAAVSEGSTARAAVGLPPLPPHTAPTPTNVLTPGVPGGPIDTPPPVAPPPEWQTASNQSGLGLGGLIQVLTVGSLAAQVLRWFR